MPYCPSCRLIMVSEGESCCSLCRREAAEYRRAYSRTEFPRWRPLDYVSQARRTFLVEDLPEEVTPLTQWDHLLKDEN